MALTVETGTVVSGADSLLSLAAFKTYADAQGWSYDGTYADDALEQALRRGSRFISDAYSYQGRKVSRDQVFAFPRYDLIDPDGCFSIASDDIPVEVERAVAEAAWREAQSPGATNADVNLSERVKSETVGPLSTTYADLPTSAKASRTDYKIIRDILRPLLNAGGGVELVRS